MKRFLITIGFIGLPILLDSLFGTIEGVNYAIAPLVIAGIGAGVGALANLLKGDGTPDKITYADLIKNGYKPMDVTKMVGDTMRYSEAMKKKALSNANQTAVKQGFDPVAVNYSATENIDTQTQKTISDIENQAQLQEQEIQNKLAMRNAGIDATPSEPIASKIIGGAVQGAGMGLSIASLLSKISPSTTSPTGNVKVDTKPATVLGTTTPVTTQGIQGDIQIPIIGNDRKTIDVNLPNNSPYSILGGTLKENNVAPIKPDYNMGMGGILNIDAPPTKKSTIISGKETANVLGGFDMQKQFGSMVGTTLPTTGTQKSESASMLEQFKKMYGDNTDVMKEHFRNWVGDEVYKQFYTN